MDRKQVLFLTGSLNVGGTERNILHLATRLDPERFDIEVWSDYEGEPLQRELQEEMRIEVAVGEELTVIEHAYTHFRITLHAFLCRLEVGEPTCVECDDFQWATLDEIRALPMPVTDRQIAETVEAFLQQNPS